MKKIKRREEIIRKLRKKGCTLLKEANYDEAIELFLESLELAPCDELTLKCLYKMYFKMKEYKQAEFYSKMLLDMNKNNIEANNMRFNILLKQNKFDEAKEFLDNNEILKREDNYYEMKSLVLKEIARQNINKTKIFQHLKIINYPMKYCLFDILYF